MTKRDAVVKRYRKRGVAVIAQGITYSRSELSDLFRVFVAMTRPNFSKRNVALLR